MKRFITAAATATLVAGGAYAQDYSFKFQSSDPAGNPNFVLQQGWAESVAEKTDGRIQIELLPVESIVAHNETQDAIAAGIEPLRVVDGAMQDPTGPWVVAWYENLGALGAIGNVVMAGHVDYWNVGPSVFFNIRDLTPGDKARASFLGWAEDDRSFFVSTNERDPRFMDLYEYAVDGYGRTLVFRNEGGFDLGPISRDKRYLALIKSRTTSDSDIHLFDRQTKKVSHLTPHTGNVAFAHPDNAAIVARAADAGIHIWDGYGRVRTSTDAPTQTKKTGTNSP